MAESRTNMVSLIDIGSWLGGKTAKIVEMGDGFTELTEDWGPDVESTQYVNMKAKASTLKMKEVLGGVVSKVSDGVKKGVNGLKKIKNSIGGVLSKLKNLRAGANKTSSGFSNLLKTMRQMVLSMAVFQAMSKGVEFLKSGLQNLAVYSKEYNKNMSALVSSTGMLKNSLAVAFAPIISAVIPYLVKLIDWISAAANAVSRFFAIAEFTGGVIVSVLDGIGDALSWIAENEVAMAILEGLAIAIGLVSAAFTIFTAVSTAASAAGGVLAGVMVCWYERFFEYFGFNTDPE